MAKSTRLQMPTLDHLKLNSQFPRWNPQANPVVPRQSLHTLILVIRSVSQSYQSSQQFWWHPHLCPNTKHERPCWLTHIRIRIWSLLSPLVRLLPSSPRRLVNRRTAAATPHPTTTLRVRASGLWTWSWNPRLSCSTRFLHPSDGIRGRDILWNWYSRHTGSN